MDRERITISIRKQVLDLIDRTIDGTKVRNRSHAIESLIVKASGQETRNALILLGGDDALKALPATKKYLNLLSGHGFSFAHIAVGFLGDRVREKLGDGADYGIGLNYTSKGEGSGGAIASYRSKFKNTFLVFNTGKEINIDLDFYLKFHKEHNSLLTVITDDWSAYEGIYICEPEIFNYIPKDFSMFEETVIPDLIKQGKALIYPIVQE